MKKNTTLFILFLLFTLHAFAQNFSVLATDPKGDPTQSVNDVERFSIAIDTQKDSLWFKLDFHQNLSGDVGFIFGLDTDQDPNTGTYAWNGIQTGLNCDQLVIINRNLIAPNTYYGSSTINGLNHAWTQSDDTSLIVSMKLSMLDADGAFNLIMGSGGFDMTVTNRRVFDEIPGMGWVVVSPATNNELLLSSREVHVFPQPAKDRVNIEFTQSELLPAVEVSVLGLEGKVLYSQPTSDSKLQLGLEALPAGIYVLQFRVGKALFNRKLIIE